jgi:UDP-N-acetylmuramyl pentapeptide synthase
MGEVGDQGEAFHREVGRYASEKKISNLFALGEATKHSVEAFGKGGRHFQAVEELVQNVGAKSILVKGSRFMRMERVVSALTGTAGGGH